VILWRVLPWDPSAGPHDRGGPLYIPRGFQGRGRHDNPGRYGCLYATVEAASGVAEILAQFRGQPLVEGMLDLDGMRLAAVPLELPDESELVDLDEPRVLQRERLRPSRVATRDRTATQAYAERLFDAHSSAAGIRWWSTFESTWINVTLFDRAAPGLSSGPAERLTLDHPSVAEAAELLGLV
jgi:RES domain-containing protein